MVIIASRVLLIALSVAIHCSVAFSASYLPKLKAEWVNMSSASNITPKRSGHVSFRTTDGRLLVFGGYAEEDDKERYVVQDLWEWKQPSGWVQVSHSGSLPGPRLASAAGLIVDSPYLLGGWDPQTPGTGGVILDTVHKFDSSTNKWTLMEGVTLPGGPASRHVVLSLKDQLLMHNHRCSDHVYLFDGEKFIRQATTGEAPSSRGLHAGAMLSDKIALVFGGAAQDGNMSNEAFVLDTISWKWTRLDTSSSDAHPSPRAGHCLCRFSDTCLILYGGASRSDSGLIPNGDVWALHISDEDATGTWQILSQDGMLAPPSRNAATLNLIDESNGKKKYLLTGGWAPFVQTYGDCFVLQGLALNLRNHGIGSKTALSRRLKMAVEASSILTTLDTGLHQSELEVKKSRFIGYARHASSWKEAQEYLDIVRSENTKARHVCFGFIASTNSAQERCSDDGEPTGTAGLPILGAIKGEGLTDTLCVVVRYFGGVKLGAGGLIRAYGAGARQVLREAPKNVLIPKSSFGVLLPSVYIGAVYDSVLKAGGNTSDEVYGSDGSLSAKITCEAEKEGELREALNDATRGEVSFLKGMDA